MILALNSPKIRALKGLEHLLQGISLHHSKNMLIKFNLMVSKVTRVHLLVKLIKNIILNKMNIMKDHHYKHRSKISNYFQWVESQKKYKIKLIVEGHLFVLKTQKTEKQWGLLVARGIQDSHI